MNVLSVTLTLQHGSSKHTTLGKSKDELDVQVLHNTPIIYDMKLFSIFERKTSDKRGRDFLKKSIPKNSVGCELGVWKGEFSELLLEWVKPTKLYLVDPWLFQPEFSQSWYGGTVANNQAAMDDIYKDICERFGNKANVQIVRKKTEELVDEIPDHSLDWAYIDANHAYDHVLRDLRTFELKIKHGGIFFGDDYGSGKKSPSPVAEAVQDFLKESGYSLSWVKKRQFCIHKP